MAKSLNKIMIIGNVGRDPEVRYIGDTPVANFSVATSRSWKDKQTGEWEEKTEWHRVVAWRYLAETAGKLSKGDRVYVEGALETREWQDKEGNKRTTTEIIARDLFFYGSRPDPRDDVDELVDSPAVVDLPDEDDLPF